MSVCRICSARPCLRESLYTSGLVSVSPSHTQSKAFSVRPALCSHCAGLPLQDAAEYGELKEVCWKKWLNMQVPHIEQSTYGTRCLCGMYILCSYMYNFPCAFVNPITTHVTCFSSQASPAPQISKPSPLVRAGEAH